MTDIIQYKKLIERYRTWILGGPDTDLLMAMMELRFTPEEAGFLARIPFMPHTKEQLSEKLGMSLDELTGRMAPLLKKGFIYEVAGRTAVRYTLTDQLFAFYRLPGWTGEDSEFTRTLAPLQNKYYIEQYGADFTGHTTQGLRAIPIAQTVQDTRQILPYEDILYFVDQEDYHTVSECACRVRHNLDPDFETCKYETTNCLHFGRLGRYIVKHGMGKEISKTETLEILKNAADAGLVHGISNMKKGADTICNCCSCCCIFLETIHIDPPNPRGHNRSNYRLALNPETCKACGLVCSVARWMPWNL